MAKFLDDVELIKACVRVFDKSNHLLYQGYDASEWIIENALEPDHVTVEGVEGAFTIDQYMQEIDKQNEEYRENFPEIQYYRERTEGR